MHMNRRSDTPRAKTQAPHRLIEGDASRSTRAVERRATRRYSIEAELEYRITRQEEVLHQGRGFTVNISSSGVLFECPLPLPVGRRVEVSILWPAHKNSANRLELFAEGRIVRNEQNQVAVQIKRYEFRDRNARTPN
jgi:hypothetical protein